MLVIPVVITLINHDYRIALILFFVAGISDGIDGYLARHFNWMSRLGGLLDPLADKLLMVSTYLTLTWLELLPLWLVAIVVGRDVVIFTGAVSYRIVIGPFKAAPTLVSKVCTVSQIMLGVLVVFQQAFMPLWDAMLGYWLLELLKWSVVVFSLASGLQYVVIWWLKAKRREVDEEVEHV